MRWMLLVVVLGAGNAARADASADVMNLVQSTLGQPRPALSKRWGQPTADGTSDIFTVPSARLHVSYVDGKVERVEVLNAGTDLSFPGNEPLVADKRTFARETVAGHVAWSSEVWPKFLVCEKEKLEPGARKIMARALEIELQDQNIPAHISVAPPENRIMRIRYTFCSEGFLLRLRNGGHLEGIWQSGIERVECRSEYGGGAFMGAKPKTRPRCKYR